MIKPISLSFVLLALGSGCVAENSPWMRPGENCMTCHNAAPGARAHKKPWTVGGTLYSSPTSSTPVEGAQVLIVDARGTAVTLTSNGAGNFYTGETLEAPFQYIAVRKPGGQVVPMVIPPPKPNPLPPNRKDSDYLVDGSCNRCHSADGIAAAPVYVP